MWVAGGALTLATAALLLPLPGNWQNTWRSKLLDLGHIPLFAALPILLRPVVGSWPTACGISLALAAGGEILQSRLGRSGNVADFLRGCVGVALVGLWIRPAGTDRQRALISNVFGSIALLIWPIVDAYPTLHGAALGYRQFPVLCAFEHPNEQPRWEVSAGRLILSADGGELTFLPTLGEEYAAANLYPIVTNWTQQQRLCIDLEIIDGPMHLTVCVNDRRKVVGYHERFNHEADYAVGQHELRFSLTDIQHGPTTQPLNMANVECLYLFIRTPDRPQRLRLRRIWLE